eukprot:scaffold7917_cov183-Alexandrium_tamarense.AAC.8
MKINICCLNVPEPCLLAILHDGQAIFTSITAPDTTVRVPSMFRFANVACIQHQHHHKDKPEPDGYNTQSRLLSSEDDTHLTIFLPIRLHSSMHQTTILKSRHDMSKLAKLQQIAPDHESI